MWHHQNPTFSCSNSVEKKKEKKRKQQRIVGQQGMSKEACKKASLDSEQNQNLNVISIAAT